MNTSHQSATVAHRGNAIRAGRLRGERSVNARTQYQSVIEAIARKGSGNLLRRPINERAVGVLLEAVDASHIHDAFVDFCRRDRNHAWVAAVVEGAA